MMKKIPYRKWRERIEEITPYDHRIGTDILLIDNAGDHSMTVYDGEPFKVDMTMAIIYEKGSAALKINMVEYKVEAPCILIVMNDQIYEPLWCSDDLQSKVIVMSRGFSDSLFSNFSEINPLYSTVHQHPVMSMTDDQDVFSRYYEMLYNLARSPQTDFKIDAAKHLTLAMFYGYSHNKHGITDKVEVNTRRDEIYSNFIELLGKHFRSRRDIGFYADKLCITSKYLSSLIKEQTGRTALDCIEDYVISECKALLSSTAMTIQQISDELNFPSQSVFGKYFKRITGMSPKEYRKGGMLQ